MSLFSYKNGQKHIDQIYIHNESLFTSMSVVWMHVLGWGHTILRQWKCLWFQWRSESGERSHGMVMIQHVGEVVEYGGVTEAEHSWHWQGHGYGCI